MTLRLAAASTLDKLKQVPTDFWMRLGLFVAAIVAVVIVLRLVANVNKVVLVVVLAVAGSMMGFNWIYQRNEPAFLTPVVERIAPFFPSKNGYSAKQGEPVPTPTPTPAQARVGR